MSMRTDLALESANQISATSPVEGVVKTASHYKDNEICVTEIAVSSPEAGQKLGKPQGRYVTIENTKGSFSLYSHVFNEQVNIISDELKKLMGKIPEKIMFVGLGNRAITPDSLGPSTAEKIFATRHIKRLAKDIDTSDMSDVSVVTTGVMAQTGVESSETVRAIADFVKPDTIIIVDALACSELEHLGTTIQLTDTGISPGSGVENARKELSYATLGVQCIAIGVPTVADMSTVAEGISDRPLPREFEGMIVTPKSIDNLIMKTSGLIATAINRTFHPNLTDEEITSGLNNLLDKNLEMFMM